MSPLDLVLTPTHVRYRTRKFPCSIGRGGLSSAKHEGDGATPKGQHRIVALLYRPERITCPPPWAVPIGKDDLWSDASGTADYNQMVQAPYQHSHENLRRADPLYDLILVTDWNWPNATQDRGSAIFLHQWRSPGYPTEGCIAFARDHLRWIAERAHPGTRLIIQ